MLRGAESNAEEAFVRKLSREYHVEFYIQLFETKKIAQDRKISIQMAARDLRYEWFEQLLTEFDFQYVATAHHQDDQIESFLINLSRGSGLAGLHGILPKSGHVIRPMLFASRSQILEFIQKEELIFKEDSSKAS